MACSQVPEIYKEMESAGFTPDRKAREMMQNVLLVLQQRHCEYCVVNHKESQYQ